MSKGRIVPHLSTKEIERRTALQSLDVPAMRLWAKRYSVGLLGDDRVVLISMHEMRVVDPVISPEERHISVEWLLGNYIRSNVLPRTLVTDRPSIRDYHAMGYTFRGSRPYWALYAPDESLYALVDSAAAEGFFRETNV